MPITFKRPEEALELAPATTAGQVPSPSTLGPAGVDARDQAGQFIVQLYRYLERHALSRPVLAPAVEALREAVVTHRTGTSSDPFAGVLSVVRLINAARESDPSLPEP